MPSSRNNKKPAKLWSYLLIALLLGAAAAAAVIPDGSSADKDCTAGRVAASDYDGGDLLLVAAPDGFDGRILHYEGFTVAFNAVQHIPYYVTWALTPEHTDGPYSRKDVDFRTDPEVDGCATADDYRRSGFDRGHIAPAADMKWSAQAMSDCHYFTNICPQDKKLNTGAWNALEKATRKWAQKFGTLYIVSGPITTDRITRHIGKSQVAVPERFFKVIIAPEANPPMGIAFIMSNSYVDGGMQSTVTSIDNVEAVTGYDFFYNLPDDIENAVEAQSSLAAWNRRSN